MKLFKEKAGVISYESTWCIIDSCYLYTHPSFIGVIYQYVTEYKHDKHLVG